MGTILRPLVFGSFKFLFGALPQNTGDTGQMCDPTRNIWRVSPSGQSDLSSFVETESLCRDGWVGAAVNQPWDHISRHEMNGAVSSSAMF